MIPSQNRDLLNRGERTRERCAGRHDLERVNRQPTFSLIEAESVRLDPNGDPIVEKCQNKHTPNSQLSNRVSRWLTQ